MKVGQFRIEKVLKQGNFARVLIVSLLIMFPVQVMAQASGGQIRRNNTTSTAIKKKKKPNLPPNSVKLDDGTIVEYETTQAVDLGLPSGTIWAGWNIGAKSPLEVGTYYAWGETEEKDIYDWNTYFDIESLQKDIFGKIVKLNFYKYKVNGSLSIIGTRKDVAYIKWGEQWQMPTKNQIMELRSECRVSLIELSDKKMYAVFIGPNGKSILFPMCGSKFENKMENNRELIWSGEIINARNADDRAYSLGLYGDYPQNSRCCGMNVRAVRKY
jgi:hypothetical protein